MDRIHASGSFLPSDDFKKSSSAGDSDEFGNVLADIWGKLDDIDVSDVAPPVHEPVSSLGSSRSPDPSDPFAAISQMQFQLLGQLKRPPVSPGDGE